MQSGLHKAKLSLQTGVGKLKKKVGKFVPSHLKLTHVKSQQTVIYNMAALYSAMALTYRKVKRRKREEKKLKAAEK